MRFPGPPRTGEGPLVSLPLGMIYVVKYLMRLAQKILAFLQEKSDFPTLLQNRDVRESKGFKISWSKTVSNWRQHGEDNQSRLFHQSLAGRKRDSGGVRLHGGRVFGMLRRRTRVPFLSQFFVIPHVVRCGGGE